MLWEWEHGGAWKRVEEERRCPRGRWFRHLHGSYTRFVVAAGDEFEIRVPKLLRPACGKTSGVRPSFLAARSPYPRALRQAAILSFLDGGGGYRSARERFSLDWQLLWGWLDALAGETEARLAMSTGFSLRYPGLVGPVSPGPAPRVLDGLRARARSPAKQESLAVIPALLATGYRLWEAGFALGVGWPRPDPDEVLGFLAGLEPAMV